MDIARYSIEKPVNTWLIVVIALIGGLWGLSAVGRLEDPAFTIKEAQVITAFPGGSAVEVEQEVTEVLETAIQQLAQLDTITSTSQPGLSRISVKIKSEYDGSELPQVWDELRRKVADAAGDLPDGARAPLVYDSFGDVFGLYHALTWDEGYANAEVRETVKRIKRELLTVPGVAKVELRGEPQDRIRLDIDLARLAQLGISLDDVAAVIGAENAVQPSGSGRVGDRRVRIAADPAFDVYRAVADLKIGVPGSTAMIALSDVATLEVVEPETPGLLIRHGGRQAVTIGVSQVPDTNIVEVGEAVEARLALIRARLPVGMSLDPIYQQDVVVAEAVDGFILNLAMSVAIVIGVLCLFMGWRAGVVVGAVLLLTVLATVFLMAVFGIDMQRISLGALIIAMGMLVDNAIVVAEGMMIGMRKGARAVEAASAVVRQTLWPLLGATVIGIMAFSGIGLSPDSTGEFLFSLFAVIGLSLMLSWVFAVTVTPLLGKIFFRAAEDGAGDEDVYKGAFYALYRGLLKGVLRARWLTVAALIAVTAVCFVGFGQLKQAFFPDSNTPIFFLNYWLPQGADIRATERDMIAIEKIVLDDPRTAAATTLIGQGASRFMLTYAPESPNPSFGHMLIRAASLDVIDAMAVELRGRIETMFPDAEATTQRIVFGPGAGAKIEARFSGPDAAELRRLGDAAAAILTAPEARLKDVRTDWRQPEIVLKPIFDEDRARIGGVTRSDLAFALRFALDGVRTGSFRNGDETVPIIARKARKAEGDAIETLDDALVWNGRQRRYVPLDQVVSRIEPATEDTLIRRRDRLRTLTVMADVTAGETAASALARVRGAVEAIELPPGYALDWGGEFESTRDAQSSLAAQLPLGFLVMVVISILLFGSVRHPLIIWLMVPMSVNGVVIALLGTDTPFGFVALLGMLSLSGMLIKNAIVLLDEIDLRISHGRDRHAAVIDASVSRMRPVLLAAVTTILGMAPLIQDAFFKGMAVAIMGGLAFATILTLIATPVLYALFFGIRPPRAGDGRAARGERVTA